MKLSTTYKWYMRYKGIKNWMKKITFKVNLYTIWKLLRKFVFKKKRHGSNRHQQ